MENRQIKIEPTLDGTPTLYVPEIDEHYHSINGAREESIHVYINAGLKQCVESEISIFEVGFGTGLNALTTYAEILNSNKKVVYQSIELFPVESSVITTLNYAKTPEERAFFEKIHQAPWNQKVTITPQFTLLKINANLVDFDFSNLNADVIYFDAFSPDKQPDLWTKEVFEKVFNATNDNGIITTYCAKGVVRRTMRDVGFTMERIPGFSGKREMLRGIKK